MSCTLTSEQLPTIETQSSPVKIEFLDIFSRQQLNHCFLKKIKSGLYTYSNIRQSANCMVQAEQWINQHSARGLHWLYLHQCQRVLYCYFFTQKKLVAPAPI
jgi:hypothetical protein